MTNSRQVLAAVRDELPEAVASGALRRTTLFVVASPRPQVGKTFLARLITDFLRLGCDRARAFDLNPGGEALRDYLPHITFAADLADIRGQMALFDCLIHPDAIPKVVDLGSASYQQFFSILAEIGFAPESRRRSIELTILYAANSHPASVKGYAELERRFPEALLVPVFSEAFVKGKSRQLRDQYPFARAAAVPLQIPLLPPMLKAHLDRSAYSFAEFHSERAIQVPYGAAVELHAWTRRAFLEFRELELRMLLEKLRASLPGVRL